MFFSSQGFYTSSDKEERIDGSQPADIFMAPTGNAGVLAGGSRKVDWAEVAIAKKRGANYSCESSESVTALYGNRIGRNPGAG